MKNVEKIYVECDAENRYWGFNVESTDKIGVQYSEGFSIRREIGKLKNLKN
jgi:hypothetical protein